MPAGPPNQASNLQPHLWIVAFQDGQAFGDAHWLAELHARRQAAYQEIGSVSTLLNQAVANHESNAEIIASLEERRKSLIAGATDPQPRNAAEEVTIWADLNLKQPPAAVSANMNMDPQERIPSLILPWLSRWRAALQQYDSTVK